MKHLRPVFDMWRLAWLRFKRNTMNPLSPDMPQLVLRINRLENHRH